MEESGKEIKEEDKAGLNQYGSIEKKGITAFSQRIQKNPENPEK
jgi:hypothetical protein